MKTRKTQGVETIQRRRERLLKRLKLPEDGLLGSLSVSRFHCGKSNCHCLQEKGHEKWTLTYMRDGNKQVKHIPADLVESVRERVEQGRTFKEEVNEIFGANAELLVLLQRDNKKRKS